MLLNLTKYKCNWNASFDSFPFVKAKETVSNDFSTSEKFYSPLVKNIAKEEGISVAELDAIDGTGKDGRIIKEDVLAAIEAKKSAPAPKAEKPAPKKEKCGQGKCG